MFALGGGGYVFFKVNLHCESKQFKISGGKGVGLEKPSPTLELVKDNNVCNIFPSHTLCITTPSLMTLYLKRYYTYMHYKGEKSPQKVQNEFEITKDSLIVLENAVYSLLN